MTDPSDTTSFTFRGRIAQSNLRHHINEDVRRFDDLLSVAKRINGVGE